MVSAIPLFAADPSDAVRQAATALANGNASAFAGLGQTQTDTAALVNQADAQSTIEFRSESGDSRSRTLQMDWDLRITDKASSAVTTRRARVTCRFQPANGAWRIVSFEPREFFRPPRVDGAWNLLESAAAALSDGRSASFLSYFEKSMPGYEKVASGAAALVDEGEVQSSIDQLSNEGTDTTRTIVVDWTLQVVSEDTQMKRGGREQRVTCRLELQKKRWRLTSVEPVDFFSVILLASASGRTPLFSVREAAESRPSSAAECPEPLR